MGWRGQTGRTSWAETPTLVPTNHVPLRQGGQGPRFFGGQSWQQFTHICARFFSGRVESVACSTCRHCGMYAIAAIVPPGGTSPGVLLFHVLLLLFLFSKNLSHFSDS